MTAPLRATPLSDEEWILHEVVELRTKVAVQEAENKILEKAMLRGFAELKAKIDRLEQQASAKADAVERRFDAVNDRLTARADLEERANRNKQAVALQVNEALRHKEAVALQPETT